jgi:NAD(P)-dependent dehydrogenase (short-subunit alcohol dehydrogenase family)
VEAGATVFISARNAQNCDAAAKTLSGAGRCVSLPSDVSRTDGIVSLAEKIAAHAPALNILVNNAGVTWNESIETFPEAQWDTVLDLNLKAPFFLVQRLLPLLRKAATPANPARVINIGSVAGLVPMRRETFAYAASKSGLHHMTQHLARHLAPAVTSTRWHRVLSKHP